MILRPTPADAGGRVAWGQSHPEVSRTYWDPDVFVGCQCSLALASIYVIGGSGFLVLVWSPTA